MKAKFRVRINSNDLDEFNDILENRYLYRLNPSTGELIRLDIGFISHRPLRESTDFYVDFSVDFVSDDK